MAKKRVRPDFSDYVVHFTKEKDPFHTPTSSGAFSSIAGKSAYEKLLNILDSGEIWASEMPWVHAKATCFTECTWSSLFDHANEYSPFGIGFSKAFLFACGGSPVFYMRADTFYKQRRVGFHDDMKGLITPFWPVYAPKKHKDKYYRGTDFLNYSHEREWRVLHNLTFEPSDVSFVVVDRYKDMAVIPGSIKDAIGRDKFLIMENYKTIEKLWPTRYLP